MSITLHFSETQTMPVLKKETDVVSISIKSDDCIRKIKVWYHKPRQSEKNAPIVFIMHGLNRDADVYRDNWIKFADEKGFIVLAPEFSQENFPTTENYNFGNIINDKGQHVAKENWSFFLIECIFDEIISANDFSTGCYDMFGHSAGAQFVHRNILLLPNSRIRTAVAANAGWYSFPDLTIQFPYGLAGTPISKNDLKVALGKNLVVLLGTKDNDPNHHNLRRAPDAILQGAHRLERGKNFFAKAREQAELMQTPFNWHLKFAENVAHDNKNIANYAKHFLGDPLPS